MPLDPQVESLLAALAEQGAPAPETLTVEQNREVARTVARLAGAPEPVAAVHDAAAPGPGGDIPLRVYVPEGSGPSGVLVYYHGGGWTIGDLDTHDAVCRVLANRAGVVVVAVDYRLAPEHRFPAAVDDAVAALAWVHAHAAEYGGDPGRLAVGGDSAGGNLAAVVAQHARDHGGPALRFQLLVYPAVDAADASPSMTEHGAGPLLSRAWIEWFMGHYLSSPDDVRDPRMSPALTADLSGLPPTLVITAENDPLRDQGAAYAERLAAAGVKAEHRPSPGMIHGFLQLGGVVDEARAALDEAGAALRAALA
ncbi:alpha/beta hydrolase [Pseudonocardia phyllosphaerae]|uniref:alpha/beta hydrolase n=1 Tax=Pseudonocardia phyllosphaerae TaxID=3390502 RepID=UPI0039793643